MRKQPINRNSGNIAWSGQPNTCSLVDLFSPVWHSFGSIDHHAIWHSSENISGKALLPGSDNTYETKRQRTGGTTATVVCNEQFGLAWFWRFGYWSQASLCIESSSHKSSKLTEKWQHCADIHHPMECVLSCEKSGHVTWGLPRMRDNGLKFGTSRVIWDGWDPIKMWWCTTVIFSSGWKSSAWGQNFWPWAWPWVDALARTSQYVFCQESWANSVYSCLFVTLGLTGHLTNWKAISYRWFASYSDISRQQRVCGSVILSDYLSAFSKCFISGNSCRNTLTI